MSSNHLISAPWDHMTEYEVLARTIWGEARSEGLAGMVAVASVIMKRVSMGYQGFGIKEVCTRKYQFSCWLEGDPNRNKLLGVSGADPIFAQCCVIAELAAQGLLNDNTQGSKHYHVTSMGFPVSWGEEKEPCVIIEDHSFYNNVR